MSQNPYGYANAFCGIQTLVRNKIDFGNSENLVITAIILVF